MDARSLLALAPLPFRPVFGKLLDRLDALEQEVAELKAHPPACKCAAAALPVPHQPPHLR